MSKISIVAPVYGVEKYIDQFLSSIHNQSFQDFDVILVDDGSKDNCPAILDEFAKKDSRYKVIHQENGGVSKARNTGLQYAKGQYIYIVDSDDWLEPTALTDLWAEAEKTQADIIYGDYIFEKSDRSELRKCWREPFVTEDLETIKKIQFAVNSNSYKLKISAPEFKGINCMGGAPWRALIKGDIIRENGLKFDPYVRGLGDDILFTLSLYEHISKVAYISKVIYHYRVVNASYSHGFKPNYLEQISRIFEKQELFLKDVKAGELGWKSYYMRVFIYLNEGMKRYFKNSENPVPEDVRYRQFVELVKSQPYSDALKMAPISVFATLKTKILLLSLHWGFYKIYWMLIK